MKNKLLLSAALALSVSTFAQSTYTGDWQGILKAGQDIPVVFHMDGDALSATLDVPTQGAKRIPCSKVFINGEKMSITIDVIKVNVEGERINDSTINGLWMQNGASVPLVLTKSSTPIKVNEKPQTPQPPYSYNSEDIVYQNTDNSMQYGATITYPKDGNRHPAVILITGSGPQNRDEQIGNHKPFMVIADHLTKKGYVVLRVDDRGIDQTSAGSKGATSQDFANDVIVAIDYLKTRKEVDQKKIGLLGHSEGGMIAPIVAQMRPKDVSFIILNAGPGTKVIDLMTEQNKAFLKSMGLVDSVVDQYCVLYKQVMSIVATAKDTQTAAQQITAAVDKWVKNTDKGIVQITTGITNDETQAQVTQQFIGAAGEPWFKYFLSYDPAPVLKDLSIPVLALYGEKDIQVVAEPNQKGMEDALSKSKSKDYKVIVIPGVNHLFQECTQCTVQEYGNLDQTIAPKVLNTISDWMDQCLK